MTNNNLQSFDDLYPGRFLKAGNLHGKKVTLTVSDVFHDELTGEKGTERKVILAFEKTDRQLVLCKLNGTCIAGMFGKSIPAWIGKRVTFFPTDTIMPMPSKKGDDRICIRVWGSPDIARDMAIEFAPPRRKAFTIPMHAVAPAASAQSNAVTPPRGNAAQNAPTGQINAPAAQWQPTAAQQSGAEPCECATCGAMYAYAQTKNDRCALHQSTQQPLM